MEPGRTASVHCIRQVRPDSLSSIPKTEVFFVATGNSFVGVLTVCGGNKVEMRA